MTALEKVRFAYDEATKLDVEIIIARSTLGDMLKEVRREPVRPVRQMRAGRPYHTCGCNTVVKNGDRFCRHCGRPLLWETLTGK